MKHKKIITIIISILIITIGNQMSFAYEINDFNLVRMDDVKVFIDGNEVKIDKPIYNFKSSTLIPMRLIFEELGVNVEWIQETKTIIASTNDKVVELSINSSKAKVNGQNQILDVEPKLIENTTYIPLRFVVESLGYEVGWNNIHKIITIINVNKIKKIDKSKIYESSSLFKDDYIKMEIIEDNKIKLEGQSISDKVDLLFMIKGQNGKEIIKEYRDISYSCYYDEIFKINNKLNNDEYKVSIYFKGRGDSSYQSYYWNIPIKYENDELYFPTSPVYLNNYLEYNRSSVINPENYLNIIFKNDLEGREIESLARDIVKDTNNDYDKLLKINNWVAENIFYDHDAYKTKRYGATDAYGTFKSRKSVCQGYAELTNALLRSINIPSRIIRGHALGVSAKGEYWNNIDHTRTNHAWNEAFVNERWVILDTTWNSNNKYENGKYNKKEMKHRYFDPSLKVFSYTHKIMND